MAFIPIQLIQFNLTSLLVPSATTMSVSPAIATQISAALGGSGFTICAISNGAVSEIVYITGASGSTATITRGQEGSTAQTFGAGSLVRFVWTTVGIQDVAGGGSTGITVTGSGATTVTGGPFAFAVATPATALTAGTGIAVTGAFPNFTVTNTSPATAVTPTIVTGSGIANVTGITGGYNVGVPITTLTAGAGITVGGSWPNFTVTNSAPATGSSGTVTSVTAGTGLVVTGTSTIAPVVGIAPTGVTAGSYGGVTVNASGQITAITAPISSVSSANVSISVATTSGAVVLTANPATTVNSGNVVLAVATALKSSDPTDSTSAVTPAGVAAVIATHSGTVTSVTPGPGMDFAGVTTSGAVSLGVPSSCSPLTTNAISGTSHTHAITGFLPLAGGTLTGPLVGTSGDFSGLLVKEAANGKQGIAVLVAGALTVSNTSTTAVSRIFLTSQVDGGTPGFLRVSSRVAGVSFTITSSSATDTSTVAYEIFEPG